MKENDKAFEEYFTLKHQAKAEILVRGSRFLAEAIPVQTEESCKKFIQELKQTHPSAAHVCFAWVLKEPRKHYRYYDDGEPNGSAGLPIYHCLLSHGLSYSVIAVVRYFGGKKLGIPGLIDAYAEASRLCIAEAEIIRKEVQYFYTLKFPVHEIWQLYSLAQQFRLEILHVHTLEGLAEVSSGSQQFTLQDELRRLFPIFEIEFKECF